MKKYFLILTIAFLYSISHSFGQVELWARTAGGAGDDEAEALSMDASGNMFVTGFFKSSTLVLADKTLKNKGEAASDVFIAKYDPSGKILWANSGGGTGEDQPLGLSVDKTGNVYIRGYFESDELIFDGIKIKNNNKGDISMFLVKYDPSGKLIWVKGSEVYPTAHYADASGNIYVTGELYQGVITAFDNIKFTPEADGMFIAKYNTDGKVLWVKKGIGSKPFSIASDASGNTYVSGIINSPLHYFDKGTQITNAGVKTDDMFLIKLSPDGKILWEKSVGGQGNEEPRAQYVTSAGNWYIVMRYTSINLKLENENIKHGGGDDLLLIKYDPSGKIIWKKNAGGSGHDNPIFLVSDAMENIYIAGHYYSDKISFDHLTLSNVGLNDIFIVKFAADSKVLWAKTTGGSHHDYPNGLLVDASGNLYLIGEFNSSANKDKVTSEFFMEKYDASGNTEWKSAEHRTESFDFAFGEYVDNAGNLYVVGYFGGNIKFANTNYKSNGSKDLFILKYNVKTNAKK